MTGYLYIVDEAGTEIPGSRRSLATCQSRADYQRLRSELERAAGDGCSVMDSEMDRRRHDD